MILALTIGGVWLFAVLPDGARLQQIYPTMAACQAEVIAIRRKYRGVFATCDVALRNTGRNTAIFD